MNEQESMEDFPAVAFIEDAGVAPVPGAWLSVDDLRQRPGGEVFMTWCDRNPAGVWLVTDVIPVGRDGRRVKVYLEAPEHPGPQRGPERRH
jgi:hypothetical protein